MLNTNSSSNTNKTNNFKRSVLPLAIASVLYSLAPGQAVAQDEEAKAEKDLNVIIVTSTRRKTSLMETGQSVSAYGEDVMESLGIDTAEDLSLYTPALVITSNKVSIRGIGRSTTALGSDPGVGIYSDGVYTSETGMFSYCNLCDISRVEVLRGPQGTLYGRNAVGGAVNFISKEPEDDFGGYLTAEFGNFDYQVLQGQITGPLGDTFSGIVTYSQMEREGFQENISNGEKYDAIDNSYISATLKATWSDDWSSSLRIVDYERTGAPTNGGYIRGSFPTDFVNWGQGNYFPGMFVGATALNQYMGHTIDNPTLTDISHIDIDHAPTLESNNKRITFTNRVDFGTAELKYTYGAFDYDIQIEADADQTNAANANLNFTELFRQSTLVGFGVDGVGFNVVDPTTGGPILLASDILSHVDQSSETTSHELQLVSDMDGDFNYIAGLYYYNSEESQYSDFLEQGFGLMNGDAIATYYGGALDTGTFLFGVPGVVQMPLYQWYSDVVGGGLPFDPDGFLYYGQNNLETTSFATYGQLEFKIDDELTITTGARYSKDEKKGGDNVFAYLAVPETAHEVEDEWSKVTWRLQADWQPDKATHFYSYIATGYRSGGFNLGAATLDEVDVVKPEELTAIEAGYKKVLMNGDMNLAASVYYYDYTDLQVSSSVVEGGVTTVQFGNAAEASVFGAEVELNAFVTDTLRLDMSYSHTQSEYDKYLAVDSVDCAINGMCDVQDLSGNKLNLAPENKFSIAATQYFEISSGEISLTAAYSYVDDQFARAFNLEQWDKIDAYDRIDLRVAWTSPSEDWKVTAWVKNLADDRNDIQLGAISTISRTQTSEVTAPQTVGLNIRYDF